MSKLYCIDKKRRFKSFLIYIFVAACFMFGCATGSSVGTNPADNADSQSNINQVDTDYSRNDTVPEETVTAQMADNETESVPFKEDVKETEYTESEPRIFIKPSASKLGQILGIDFSMMPQSKSRLTVTTNKKVDYDLDSVGANTLALNIYNSQIGLDVLLRHIDTTEFQTALEKINPEFDKDNNKVTLGIVLREVVPYTIKQSDDSLIIDFDRIKKRVAEKNIVPLNLVEAETRNLAAVTNKKTMTKSTAAPAASQAEIQAFSPSVSNKYKGEPMYLEMSKAADVTDILTLINSVSGENLVWDPAEIKGKKISIILKDEPWDYALELVMMLADLAKRQVGENTILITTKQKMAQMLAEEEAEARKIQLKLDQERERILEQAKREVDDAPIVTDYITVDFAKADEIKDHIILSKRGKISTDPRTNMIIITDTAESIEEAKKIVKQFDTPVKQIMIEARIVEVADDFTKDLGLKWNGGTEVTREEADDPLFGPIVNYEYDGTIAERSSLGSGRSYGGSFSTNSPAANWGNIGVSFAKISSSGLGFFALDATLALAESNGKAKTISAPKVIAQEGSEAKISSGEIIKIAATENVQAEDFPAELSLSVTPTSVSYNDFITLNVDVSDDQRVADNRKTTKTISTTLMVQSGETIVIGGIIKEKESDNVEGVPVLKDIPGIGWLFKAKRKQTSKTELLIFLTPNVIPAPVKNF